MNTSYETKNKEQGMSDPNENKPGYKKTKLGWIPEEWKIMKLKEILKSYRLGGNYRNIENGEGIPLIKMGNLGRGKIKLDKVDKVPYEKTIDKNDILQYNDVLFNTRNTLELVGKVAIWKNELPYALYNSNLMRIVFKEEFVALNDFMNLAFNSNYSLRQLRAYAIGTTSVAAIYTRDLLKLKFFIPPLPEQQKIAQILSTWDRAIEQTEKLIEKKQGLKKGLMQKLLSGKVRFPEFTKSWKDVKLGEIFSERVERGYNNLPLLAITDHNGVMYRDQLDKKDTSNPDKSKYKRICPGDIGYNTMRLWQGRSALSKLEGIVSPAYTIVTPNEKVDPLFMSYLFKLPKTIHLFYRYSQGLVSDTLNCKYKHFKLVHVQIPPYKEEQNKIANTLKTIDNEIDQLKTQNKLLQKQKKGLMQQLLTGKTRVKTN